MQFVEEDSVGELAAICATIKEAEQHVLVHEKAAVFHQSAMENATESAAAARGHVQEQRLLYRRTIDKYAKIFSAATRSEGIEQTSSVKQEEESGKDDSVFGVPLHRCPDAQTEKHRQDDGVTKGSIAHLRRQSSDDRVRAWQLQASAVSVAEEDVLTGSTALASTRSSIVVTSSEHRVSSDLVAPSQASHGLPNSASCGNLIPRPTNVVRITDANGMPVDLKTHALHREAMHSAPELLSGPAQATQSSGGLLTSGPIGNMSRRESAYSAPEVSSIPANYVYPGLYSRKASREAFNILAAQRLRQEKDEKRIREEAAGRGSLSEESSAFL